MHLICLIHQYHPPCPCPSYSFIQVIPSHSIHPSIHCMHACKNKILQVQCSAVITRSIFSKYSQRTPHSSPARARYGVSFVDPKSGWHSDAFLVIIHVIYYNIRPRYNGTPLYYRLPSCSLELVEVPTTKTAMKVSITSYEKWMQIMRIGSTVKPLI